MRFALIVLAIAAMAVPNAPASAQSANQTGERAFQRCYSCHSVNSGEKGLSGPSLDRLVGRRVADDPGFTYSKAFKAFAQQNRHWTKRLLDRFLSDPEAVVPGNEMGFFGLKDARERAAIVEYLAADK